jgi:hypothetical protein
MMDLSKFSPLKQEFIKAPDRVLFIANLKSKLSTLTDPVEIKQLKHDIKLFKWVHRAYQKELKEANKKVSLSDKIYDYVTDSLIKPVDFLLKVASSKGWSGVIIFILSSFLVWMGITYIALLQQEALSVIGVRDVSGLTMILMLLLDIDVIRGRKKAL